MHRHCTQNVGLVWIEKGCLKVTDPEPGGQAAKIWPAVGVKIIVNGTEISQTTEVTESCDVTLIPIDEQPQISFEFQISENHLKAYVKLNVKDGVQYKLNDTKPSPELKIKLEQQIIPATASPQDIIKNANEKGIRFGLSEKACRKACEKRTKELILIAKGEPSIPGKDAKLEFAVPLEKVIDLPLDSNQVDFRSSVKIPNVRAGEIIAVKTPVVPGIPGKGVTGKILHPEKNKDFRLRAGKGVELKEKDGLLFAVATTSGWPRYNENSGIVEVDEVYYHQGDVNLSSGNLKTSGSVEISGNVIEGMEVETEGNQFVRGTVTDAELRAWGSVTIKGNVFKSKISAGKDTDKVHKLDDLLENVEKSLAKILEIQAQNDRLAKKIKETDNEQIYKSVPAVVEPEVIFEHFRQVVLALGKLFKEDLSILPKELFKKLEITAQKVAERGKNVFEKTKMIEGNVYQVRDWVSYELSKGESDVILPYVQSSYVKASRDIIITGQGALYSNLSAGRAVKVSGSPGIVRGGEIVAVEQIQVNQAGSRGSAATILRVSSSGRIIANVIHPGTTFILGKLKARTENLLESVTIHMKDDRLVVSSQSGLVEVNE